MIKTSTALCVCKFKIQVFYLCTTLCNHYKNNPPENDCILAQLSNIHVIVYQRAGQANLKSLFFLPGHLKDTGKLCVYCSELILKILSLAKHLLSQSNMVVDLYIFKNQLLFMVFQKILNNALKWPEDFYCIPNVWFLVCSCECYR